MLQNVSTLDLLHAYTTYCVSLFYIFYFGASIYNAAVLLFWLLLVCACQAQGQGHQSQALKIGHNDYNNNDSD